MTVAIAALIVVGAVAFILFVRPQDLPEAGAESPTRHLEDKRARVYDGLRDLQFEYRLGKLSDEDYQRTKAGLQKDLAKLNAAIEKLGGPPPAAAAEEAPAPMTEETPAAPAEAATCPHCGASFAAPMKFCGECGKPMAGGAS